MAAPWLLVAAPGATQIGNGIPPAWGCPTSGLLFQYPDGVNTKVYEIDIVSGDFTQPFLLENVQINAVAHNPLDSYLYGWDVGNDELVQIASDGTVTPLVVQGTVAGSSPSGRLSGDIDPNGHYWLTGGGGSGSWNQIDIATLTVLNSGPIEGGGVSNFRGGADWAYIPGGGDALYRVMRTVDGSEAFLFRFDLVTHQHQNLGSLGDLGPPNSIGAVYADPDGFLYASNNSNGLIWRIDIGAVTATVFAEGPLSSTNDGARCFGARIPVDFGDAPDSYGTLLASNGARHGIVGYDPDTSTSSLMIGSRVDAETDGFPGPGADGDNLNNTDDEEGLLQPIVMVAGEPTVVGLTVTNTTSEPATLAGWIDLDGTGFFDPGDRQVTGVPPNSVGEYTLTFPSGTATDATYARFRLFPGDVANPQPLGAVTGGEVEDHVVLISAARVAKTSDPVSGTPVAAGDTIAYTLEVTNTGDVDITPTVTDDLSGVLAGAELLSAPSVVPAGTGEATLVGEMLTWTGLLAPGQGVSISYSVVVDPKPGPGVLTNAVTGAQCPEPAVTDPNSPGFNGDCVTVHPVESYTIAKTSDADGAVVSPGDTVNYTIVVTNTGGVAFDLSNPAGFVDDLSGVVDDASFNGDAVASDGSPVVVDGSLLTWSGPLPVGGTVTVTYSVAVDDPVGGDGVLVNVVGSATAGSNCGVIASPGSNRAGPSPALPVNGSDAGESCRTVTRVVAVPPTTTIPGTPPVTPPAPPQDGSAGMQHATGLPATGAGGLSAMVTLAGVLIVVGMAMVVGYRRSASAVVVPRGPVP